MNYDELNKKLINLNVITPVWDSVISLVKKNIDFYDGSTDDYNTTNFLKLLSIASVFYCEGNVSISINKETLKEKWDKKISGLRILCKEDIRIDLDELNEVDDEVSYFIDNVLETIKYEFPNVIGENKLFIISENNDLYTRKNFESKVDIQDSINRIFETSSYPSDKFNFDEIVTHLEWIEGPQREAIESSFKKQSLIITGGPGTGKTTIAVFILIGILLNDINTKVYIAAPSGKAANRVKESITNSLNNPEMVNSLFILKHEELKEKIEKLNVSTIHSLLETDYSNNFFKHHKDNKFEENSVFIIDEASMIDIYMFSNLLNAIPNSGRLIMMGDKDQLSSVDAGNVFASLVANDKLKSDYIVELKESRRFQQGTPIYNLALRINSDLQDVEHKLEDYYFEKFNEFDQFKYREKALRFYSDDYLHDCPTKKQKEMYRYISKQWSRFYLNTNGDNPLFQENKAISLQELCNNISELGVPSSDINAKTNGNSKTVFEIIDNFNSAARVLCAENNFDRGVNTINRYIFKECIDYKLLDSSKNYTFSGGHYTGEVLIITKNNKSLGLNNGDTGITVSFVDDDNIYLLIKTHVDFLSHEGKLESDKGRVFKIGNFVFYPINLLSKDEVSLAFAISIHKSQGSEYDNILVILPELEGHPLVTKQIVYTAITRTKGNTYIVSNQRILEHAKITKIDRDTVLDF